MNKQSLFLNIVIGIFLWISAANVYAALPDIGTPSGISLEQEKQLGREWLRNNYRILNPINDMALQTYIEELTKRIKQGPELSQYDINIVVINNHDFNAFAVPGGVIGINLGIMQLAQTEGEFASAIAHELAHLSQGHFWRRLEQSKATDSASLASVFTGIGLLLSGNIPLGALAIYGGANYRLESYLSLSRRFETEADSQAVAFLINSNFDLSDMASMFSRLYNFEGKPETATYLRTHPLTADRMNNALLRASQQTTVKFYSSGDYNFAKLRAMSILGRLPVISGFGVEGEYARALQLKKLNKIEKASRIMEKIYKDYPFSTIVFSSLLELMIEAGQSARAIEEINHKLRYFAEKPLFYYFLALAYAKDKNYTKAISYMELLAKQRPESPDLWLKLSHYYKNLGDKYNIFRTRSIYQLLIGNKKKMYENIRLAQEAAQGDHILLAQLDNLHQSFSN